MKTSDQLNEISKALASAQGEMKPATKSSSNPFFKSKYADFNSIWASIREPLRKYEIAVFQDLSTTEHGISVLTRLNHSSGQWIEFGPLEIQLTKKDPQSIGSASSYAKRYALSAAVGCVAEDEDDDGEVAMKPHRQEKPKVFKEEPKKERNINSEEIKEISKMISECPQKQQDYLWEDLRRQGISDWSCISISMFERLKTWSTKVKNEAA